MAENNTKVEGTSESQHSNNAMLAAGKNWHCVAKGQYEADPYHADWREIKAETRNKAKSRYSKLTGIEYIDILCFACS